MVKEDQHCCDKLDGLFQFLKGSEIMAKLRIRERDKKFEGILILKIKLYLEV